MQTKPLIVVMGVSGSGKSTVGSLLADALGVPFLDADDLHPQANVAKMASGHPLTDEDRWPWLALVGQALRSHDETGAVIACSALRVAYRDAIRESAPSARFVLLSGSRDLLASRVAGRSGHFMPPALLDSQLATLEPFVEGEHGIAVDISGTPDQIVARALAALEG